MQLQTEHYYNICGFLDDQEVHDISNIIGIALERHGYNARVVVNYQLAVDDDEQIENIEKFW